jgi:hypothetical protein
MTGLYDSAPQCPVCHRVLRADGTCRRPQCPEWVPGSPEARDLIDQIRNRRKEHTRHEHIRD